MSVSLDAILRSKEGKTIDVCVDDGATVVNYDSQVLLVYDGDADDYAVVRRWGGEVDVEARTVSLRRAVRAYRAIQ